MKLQQAQIWKHGDEFIRIVHLERLEVGYKVLKNLNSGEGTHHRASKKDFCRLLKSATLLTPMPATTRPSAKPPEPATGAARTPLRRVPQTVKVAFVLHALEATQVSLCGEFNDWSPTATPMKRRADGHWEATLALRPGRYQYKFVVDGQWIHDPEAHASVPNEFGSVNSVIDVRSGIWRERQRQTGCSAG
jgi:hypothetical protein